LKGKKIKRAGASSIERVFPDSSFKAYTKNKEWKQKMLVEFESKAKSIGLEYSHTVKLFKELNKIINKDAENGFEI
jgi:hypothetical protein